ncbi:MAG: discoidin domain-containing protein [Chloroflexi bacterium]|nr:discoidin domain-containing protein [Chloroflexota bacterium]
MTRTVNLSAGTQVLRVYISGNDFNLNWLRLSTATGTTNLALNKSVVASSTVNGAQPASAAVDGNQNSYWESANNAWPQQLTVDLGSSQSVSRVVLKLPASWGARNQTIAVLGSTDNASYSQIVGATSYTFSPGSNTVTINFAATSRRYIRLNFTANSGWPAAQVAEFEVY